MNALHTDAATEVVMVVMVVVTVVVGVMEVAVGATAVAVQVDHPSIFPIQSHPCMESLTRRFCHPVARRPPDHRARYMCSRRW